MKKIFVLDTSVLIHDPHALDKFGDNHLIMPMTVIEELDGLKKGRGLISLAARESLRRIDDLYRNSKCQGTSSPGNGRTIRILPENAAFAGLSPDDKIVKSAVLQKESAGEASVILISKDTAVRIKADAAGIEAQDYQNDHTELFTRYGKILDSEDYSSGAVEACPGSSS
jgi:PhoH-like ATPase